MKKVMAKYVCECVLAHRNTQVDEHVHTLQGELIEYWGCYLFGCLW